MDNGNKGHVSKISAHVTSTNGIFLFSIYLFSSTRSLSYNYFVKITLSYTSYCCHVEIIWKVYYKLLFKEQYQVYAVCDWILKNSNMCLLAFHT